MSCELFRFHNPNVNFLKSLFEIILVDSISLLILFHCQRPYHVERTRSRQLPEVKLRRVPLVLGWVTAWEYGMQLAQSFLFPNYA